MEKSREEKYQQFLCLTKPSRDSGLLDVGVADKEYSPFDNYLEKRYPYLDRITALSTDLLKEFQERYPKVTTVRYEGGKFPFEDKQFSIVHSNAVIEHVGSFREQLVFLKEMRRVGHQFFFTTPAKGFPIELHTNYPFIHWLPKTAFDRIITLLGKEWAGGSYMNLLRKSDVETLLRRSGAVTFSIMTHRMGLFPLHYAVWGR
jgi:hypothetical protein